MRSDSRRDGRCSAGTAAEETNTEETTNGSENASSRGHYGHRPSRDDTYERPPLKAQARLTHSMPSARIAGRCKARFSVFGFDPLKGKCVPYFYGGCEGSDNRFDTLEACNEACNPPASQAAKK